MQRIIFCPDEEHLDIARKLSKNNCLQIIIGDNSLTKEIDFDRKNISVLLIPERIDVSYIPNVKFGLHQIITYINEYIEASSVSIDIHGLDIVNIYKEKYRSKFAFLAPKPGNYECNIYIDSELERTFNFAVSE